MALQPGQRRAQRLCAHLLLLHALEVHSLFYLDKLETYSTDHAFVGHLRALIAGAI